jgi:hypothetical protein
MENMTKPRSTITLPVRFEKIDVAELDAIRAKRKSSFEEPPSRNAIIREMVRRGIKAYLAEEARPRRKSA